MGKSGQLVVAGLGGVVLGLLAVGLVSGTPVRHVIQVAPAVLVAAAAIRSEPRAHVAALALFVSWFLIMVAIWLWLLGLARITTGRFTPAEVALTLVIGLSCLLGTAGAATRRPRPGPGATLLAFALAGALQASALRLSLREPLAGR